MRIGILTYYAACNFGANLQALSTVEFLKSNGHEPIIISWYPQSLENQYLKSTPKEQFAIHHEFRERHFNMTERCFTASEVANVIDKNLIDAIIVGSDAVVQYIPLLSRIVFPCRKIIHIDKPGEDRDCPSPFWGNFYEHLENKIPMAMMSVSSQNSPFKTMLRKEKSKLSKYLQHFRYISTRDDWTSKQIAHATRNNIVPTITPDPVFAFNNNVKCVPTKNDILTKFNLPEKYVLVSFHNSRTVSIDWLEEFQLKMQDKGVTCVALPFPQGIEFKHPFNKQIAMPLDPIDWYALIKYSTAYIGHNMHPIVVCLCNAVPCFSFDNYGTTVLRFFINQKSSKIYHILKHFNLLQFRVNSSGKHIDPPTVEEVIEKLDRFDSKHVAEIAEEYLEKYKDMMTNILESFK